MFSRYRIVKYKGRWYAQYKIAFLFWRCLKHYNPPPTCSMVGTLPHADTYASLFGHASKEAAAETVKEHANRERWWHYENTKIEEIVHVDII